MRRFTPLRCPEGNELPKGTLETVEGVADLIISDDGQAEYGGWTEVFWNSQQTIRDAQGMVTLIGTCDHQWQAEVVDAEPGESPDEKCDCELPGYFCSGVPGILAHMENGRLADDSGVERCDLCQRYPTDESALESLRRRGLG